MISCKKNVLRDYLVNKKKKLCNSRKKFYLETSEIRSDRAQNRWNKKWSEKCI